jgi:hypothetical protein
VGNVSPCGGPCSSQHDKCKVGNMKIYLGELVNFLDHSLIHSYHLYSLFHPPLVLYFGILELIVTSKLVSLRIRNGLLGLCTF